MSGPIFQSPEFLALFEAYTGGPGSMGARFAGELARRAQDDPLIVATAGELLLFPGGGRPPEVEGFRLATRGFKELAAISHLGPALATLLRLKELEPEGKPWREEAQRLLATVRGARAANSVALWRDCIAVQAFRGREEKIAAMCGYACDLTERYLLRVLEAPAQFTAHDLREAYLEAKGSAVGATVPMNAVMIATFFLVALDTAHRVIAWFDRHALDWSRAMVVIAGKQGRPTAGVTWSSNAVCSMIRGASRHRLALDRVLIAPHAPAPVPDPAQPAKLQAQEAALRGLWCGIRGTMQLGPLMYEGYPRFAAEAGGRPRLQPHTTEIGEMPAIAGPQDWRAFNTRMRVILEDPRQLLAGCVTDYVVDQLAAQGNDPARVEVSGLDGFDYR